VILIDIIGDPASIEAGFLVCNIYRNF